MRKAKSNASLADKFLRKAKEKEGHINIKETRAVWLGLLTFAKDLSNCQIKCRIDNTKAVAY